MDIIGKKVKIIDSNHPHYKETGTIKDIVRTAFGSTGMIIKLDNCPLGVESCFVFDAKKIKLI